MGQFELQEILKALNQFSTKIEARFDSLDTRMDRLEDRIDGLESRMDQLENRIEQLENKMEKRFERLEKKFDGLSVTLAETQETIDFLLSKNLQHEKKLRNLTSNEA
ncbi:hypothetical protein SAMN05880501_106248 [Ureibacillus xyleni]|uniref:Uncharacterized protein n=1 Tax=Ureibacillus xyleni TaxID=614648 RepID=A0A285SY12_9BACL|nr:hypothetical protein [Ureibacillus xyleni]SOC11690.1 hypothetical protein SAMN05880501_106248 [Ureibacillus xyleni]